MTFYLGQIIVLQSEREAFCLLDSGMKFLSYPANVSI